MPGRGERKQDRSGTMVGPQAAVFGHTTTKLGERQQNDLIRSAVRIQFFRESPHRIGQFGEQRLMAGQLLSMSIESIERNKIDAGRKIGRDQLRDRLQFPPHSGRGERLQRRTSVTESSKAVSGLEGALEDGVWFDGSSVEGFARIQESDMRLVLDPDTYAVLPWSLTERRRARVFCDIFMPDGEPFEGDPRGVLKRLTAKIAKRGWTFNIGPEPEFFLFKSPNGGGVHPVPHDVGGYFDFSAGDDAVRVRTELMDALRSMGLEVEVGHHEVALGQHEIDFRFTDAVRAADNVLTLKYTVKAIAAPTPCRGH